MSADEENKTEESEMEEATITTEPVSDTPEESKQGSTDKVSVPAEPVVPDKVTNKRDEKQAKVTSNFITAIRTKLLEMGRADPLFMETLKKENKDINDCITYILNTVQKSGCQGFTDDEIYAMAVHYYDEDDIEVGTRPNMNVVVNHTVELTEDEIKEAREEAINDLINEEKTRMKKKPKSTIVLEKKEFVQESLF